MLHIQLELMEKFFDEDGSGRLLFFYQEAESDKEGLYTFLIL